MIQLNINTEKLIHHSNRLDKLGKNALPSAVRGALNKAAFVTKKDTLQSQVKKEFTSRQQNFFKAFSRVEMAKGNNVNTLFSTIGMMNQGLKGGSNYAVKDLEQQEEGGLIGGRKLIPLSTARVGNSNSKLVAGRNRISKIKNVVSTKGISGRSKGQRFIKAVAKAGQNGYVTGSLNTNERYLWRVTKGLQTSIGKRKTTFKAVPLYEINNSKKVRVKSTNFMQKSAIRSAKDIDKYYIEEARRVIKRYAK